MNIQGRKGPHFKDQTPQIKTISCKFEQKIKLTRIKLNCVSREYSTPLDKLFRRHSFGQFKVWPKYLTNDIRYL